jgi:Domain of Unknown Function (DUF1259)
MFIFILDLKGIMKKTILAVTLSSIILATILVGTVFNSSKLAFATETSKECEDAAKKISDKAEAHQSDNVCGIELSRDSPTLNLLGKKINDQVPMEFPYQPASASSGSKVLMLTEFTLLQSEVDKVNQHLLDHHWTISAVHNHWFDESPRLIFLHAQKQDNLNNILNEVRGALQQTNCGCV